MFLYYHYHTVKNICEKYNSLDKFTINNNQNPNGPTILIVGGTHGNEPAGSIGIKEILDKLNTNQIQLKTGKLILVPKVNNCGIQTNSRFIPFIWDLNRKYPKTQKEAYKNNITRKTINDAIIELVWQADFILDFHEGWGYHKQNKKSVGSTLTPTNTINSKNISEKILKILNNTIEDSNKKFMIMTNDSNLIKQDSNNYSLNEELKGTLRHFCELLNKDYILVETTGQDNIQKLDTRVEQVKLIITETLKNFKMID